MFIQLGCSKCITKAPAVLSSGPVLFQLSRTVSSLITQDKQIQEMTGGRELTKPSQQNKGLV